MLVCFSILNFFDQYHGFLFCFSSELGVSGGWVWFVWCGGRKFFTFLFFGDLWGYACFVVSSLSFQFCIVIWVCDWLLAFLFFFFCLFLGDGWLTGYSRILVLSGCCKSWIFQLIRWCFLLSFGNILKIVVAIAVSSSLLLLQAIVDKYDWCGHNCCHDAQKQWCYGRNCGFFKTVRFGDEISFEGNIVT